MLFEDFSSGFSNWYFLIDFLTGADLYFYTSTFRNLLYHGFKFFVRFPTSFFGKSAKCEI